MWKFYFFYLNRTVGVVKRAHIYNLFTFIQYNNMFEMKIIPNYF